MAEEIKRETSLKIVAYDKPDGNKKQSETPSFTVPFNPNTFTVSNKIEYKKTDAKGTDGGDPQFDKIPPIEFSIEFTIDGTGVSIGHLSEAEQDDYVKKQIKELRKVTGSNINGEIHRPNYLGLLWGTFYIECVLTSLNIVYNLFDHQGVPLRAKVTCGFLERIGPGKDGRKSRLESPDLTKHIVVKEGDILPLIARDNYDSSAYYLQIARANKLKNFRKIQPGTKLILPPMIDKDE
jgi:nucleoid-associated protein YgaU